MASHLSLVGRMASQTFITVPSQTHAATSSGTRSSSPLIGMYPTTQAPEGAIWLLAPLGRH
eukprot:2910707-Lingulodinium_polyedra.AAC.1